MTILTAILWSLTLAGLFTSIFALFVALRSSDRSLLQRLSALSMQSKEHDATLDELSAQVKAMRQRENMRAYRRRKVEETEAPEETGAGNRGWVQDMNEKLARARLGVPR